MAVLVEVEITNPDAVESDMSTLVISATRQYLVGQSPVRRLPSSVPIPLSTFFGRRATVEDPESREPAARSWFPFIFYVSSDCERSTFTATIYAADSRTVISRKTEETMSMMMCH